MANYQLKKLANGLTVLLVPSHDAQSVVVDLFVKTGSRSETAKEQGISHFLEHFLFKGTKRYPTAMAISEIVDGLGGEMNANTGKEHTQYFMKVAHQHFPVVFDILTDMLQQPLLDDEELQREKGVILEELNMYRDTPMYEIENVLEETMWPKDTLGRNIIGTPATIKGMTRQMFAQYMGQHYHPGNMIIAIAGKFNSGEVSRAIAKHWGKLPKSKPTRVVPVTEKQTVPRLKVEYKATDQAHLMLGFRSFGVNDKRTTTALVLATILGGGMSSRLFHEVRERRGLAYYVRARTGSYLDTGTFVVSSGVQVDKVDEALTVIREQLVRIKTELVTEKELAKAKSFLQGQTVLALEDLQARMDWYLEQVAFRKTVESPEAMFAKIAKVTPKQVQAVAQDLFKKQGLTLAIIGPYKDAAKFKAHLNV
jgi:predicted Zn-dependent peptidase